MHRALADATDPEVDPDRRAWHLAQATPGFDEDVASELERSAGRAQARGGLAAAAAFLERAAALTPEPSRRARRALAAAQAKHQAGAFDAALRLVAIAESGPLNELQRAQVDLLRGQIEFAVNRGSDAPPLVAQRRQAARAARHRPCARDLPGGVVRGDLRRSPGRPRRCAQDGGCSHAGRPVAGASASARSPPRWAGCAAHGGLCRWNADVEAGTAGVPRRRTLQRGRDPLAMARVPHRHGSVGRRELVRALRPADPARPRCRRADRAAVGAQPASRHPSVAGRVRRGGDVERRGARSQRRDRKPGRAPARLFLAAWRGQRGGDVRG